MDLSGLVGRKLWITCSISGKRIFYTAIIKKVDKNKVVIKDKFNKTIYLDPDTIKRAELIE